MNVTFDFEVKRTRWFTINDYNTSLVSLKNENSNKFFINNLIQHGFDDFQKYPDLRSAYALLSSFLNVEKENIILGYGSSQILKDLFMTLDYDSIQIFNHSWEMATVYNNIFKKKIINNDFLFNENGFVFEHDVENIGGDVLYLVNPHCPTGVEIKTEEIVSIADRFKYVIIDEAYKNPLQIDHRLLKKENIIIVRTFSKLGGVPGMRLGYCLANKEITNKLYVVKPTYEIDITAVKYIKFVTKMPHVIDDHYNEMHKCFDIIKSINKGFGIHCGNFATFENKEMLKGKVYDIDSKPFVRITLTDVANHRCLLK